MKQSKYWQKKHLWIIGLTKRTTSTSQKQTQRSYWELRPRISCFNSSREGDLYEQVHRVAMDSRVGPRMGNAFMCSIEGQLKIQNKTPAFYKRYVDDTLRKTPDAPTAS